MDSEKDISQKINALMKEINEKYPELAKNISEMTDANPDEKNPKINSSRLEEYYNSLLDMLKKYNHPTLEENENRKK
jgi:hypothetical protein